MLKKFLLALFLTIIGSGIIFSLGKGDRVLANYKKGYSWYPGRISDINGDNISISYDDGDKETLPGEFVKSLNWSSGSKIECNFKGEGKYYSGTITSIKSENINITYDDGDKESTTVSRCREKADLLTNKQMNELGPTFKNYKTYKQAKSFPADAMNNQSLASQTQGALNYWLGGVDGGQWIVIKKCSVTSTDWLKWGSGDEHTGRTVNTACAIELPNKACMVLYDQCYQQHEGMGNYKGCEYRRTENQPEQIDCSLIK